jgi:predicted ArsR family transcriptional regulator
MDERVELTDPRALRAYAHPIRLALLGLLRREGPQTATQAAAAIGESVASCSFHLRQLAKYGLVEEVPGTRGRAKPWRATARYTSWRSDSDDPEVAAAATQLARTVLDHYYRTAAAWLERRTREPAAWRRAGEVGDHLVHLSADETSELSQRIAAVVAEFAARSADRPAEGRRPVHLIHLVVPQAESGPAPQAQPGRLVPQAESGPAPQAESGRLAPQAPSGPRAAAAGSSTP